MNTDSANKFHGMEPLLCRMQSHLFFSLHYIIAGSYLISPFGNSGVVTWILSACLGAGWKDRAGQQSTEAGPLGQGCLGHEKDGQAPPVLRVPHSVRGTPCGPRMLGHFTL